MTFRRQSPRRRTATCLVAIAATLTMTGCGEGDPKPGPEVAGGNAGVDERVSADIKVLDVELEYPLDGAYERGEDASLYLAISNTSSAPDSLLEVTGPDFSHVRVTGDSGALPVDVPANDTVYIGAEGEPAIELVDLNRTLHSSESFPVTFRFETAGTVTVQAMVAAEGQRPSPTYDFPDPDGDPTGDS